MQRQSLVRSALFWTALALVTGTPIGLAAMSPLLAWRDPIYILASFAGVVAMGLLLLQPLLAGGYLPGISVVRARRLHRMTGAVLVALILLHVVGLWITSPPDVVDALLLVSPTPFSAWGVIAMWALFGAALLVLLRRRLRLRWSIWRGVHTLLACGTVVGSVVHALLIEGTMEPISKGVLCVLVGVAILTTIIDLRGRRLQNARSR